MDKDIQHFFNGQDNLNWLNDFPNKEEIIKNIYLNTFNDILHYLHLNGISFTDMVNTLATKAKRHNDTSDQYLANLLLDTLETYKNTSKEYNNQLNATTTHMTFK